MSGFTVAGNMRTPTFGNTAVKIAVTLELFLALVKTKIFFLARVSLGKSVEQGGQHTRARRGPTLIPDIPKDVRK